MSQHRFPGARLLRAFTLALCAAAGTTQAIEASADGLWKDVAETAISRPTQQRPIVPASYRTVSLQRAQLDALLAQVPRERGDALAHSPAALSLPLADGRFAQFRIVESPIMADELAAKYPQIRTYLGQGIDDPTATLRFDVTPKGLHAQILSSAGTVYIDPFQSGDVDHYIAYRKQDLDTGKRLQCGVTGDDSSTSTSTLPVHIKNAMRPKVGETLRTYRLAMAATGEYTGFHGGTVLDGLSAIVTTMNRVNGIYEREVSVRMVLVPNNDLIIYTNPATDPYANSSGDLAANQTNITNVINSANYDIGHLVGTGGGGIAGLGVVCSNTQKARGLTGSSAPIGDAFDIDYVAHEMGHQFDGDHTFNGSGANCSGNIGPTAYEVGSGVTIQAYAGICANDDLQPNSEDYFHRISLDQLIAFTNGAGACGTTSATGNNPPTITPVADFTIPQLTPFALTASAIDPNGDALTYVWEQFDLGAPNDEGVLVDAGTGPLFRSFAPTTSPTRIFPSLRYILNDANAVPQVAPLEGTDDPDWFAGELLPSTNRTLNFRVTARDNRAGGGGLIDDATTLTVTTSAGPFVVTAPNTNISIAAGANTTVTWNVANTNAAGINVANVRISLSLDGGYSWPTQLAASTANNGSALVTIPANTPATNQARVRVEALGNIFFDISDANFAITAGANTPPTISDPTGSVATRQGSPTASGVVATISDTQDAAANLGVAISGAPSELVVSVQNVAGEVSLSATAACTLVAPSVNERVYPLLLTVTDTNNGVSSAAVNVAVGRNETPSIGQYINRNVTQSSTTVLTPSALVADANSNLVATTVSPTTLPGGGTIAIAADGVVTVTTVAGTTFGFYTVSVEARDSCGAIERRSFTIQVSAPAATLDLASTQLTTGNALIEPNECNALNVVLRNDGNIPATAVTATLSTLNANATITTASTSFADIPPGESRTSLTPLQISTTGAAQCFTNLDLILTATFSAVATNSPLVENFALPIGRVAGTNYEFTASSGATIPAGGVLLAGSQTDDSLVTLNVPAGFSTSIYGTVVGTGGLASVRVGANGNLQLTTTTGANDWDNTFLPAVGVGTGNSRFPAAPTLFPFWDDLNLGTANDGVTDGGIFTQLVGSAPNRTWIIEWRGERWGNTATLSTVRFAIELKEGSNEFAYVYTNPVGAMGSSATIGVQAARTGTVFTQYSLNSPNVSGGTRLTAVIPGAVCNPGSGVCGAPAGVTIFESIGSTDVSEGGATDTYSVVLNTAPSADVTIAINPGAQVTVAPNPLTFTTANWFTAQTVTVTAVDDAVIEGAHSGNISHSASGGGYDAVVIAGVVATIGDNDVGADAIFSDSFE